MSIFDMGRGVQKIDKNFSHIVMPARPKFIKWNNWDVLVNPLLPPNTMIISDDIAEIIEGGFKQLPISAEK